MTWTYSGDPSTSKVDEYRFLLGDTIEEEPVLQDEEISYLITKYANEGMLLYKLFETASITFARDIKKSLGPQSQDPTERLKFFKDMADKHRTSAMVGGIPKAICVPPIFYKGMHDNVRGY